MNLIHGQIVKLFEESTGPVDLRGIEFGRQPEAEVDGTDLRQGSLVKLHIFLDRSSVEVFVNEGDLIMTDRVYPSLGSDGIELYSNEGRGKVLSLSIWKLGSIWN